MNQDNFIQEIQQISLIQKKLPLIPDNGTAKNEDAMQLIENIELMNDYTTKFVNIISSGNLEITEELVTILNHELRTPMVPILAYGEMLLQGHFGTLNIEQEKRIRSIVANVKQLQQKIESLLDRKTNDVKPTESEVDHKTREWEQEKKILEKINELLDKKIKEDHSEIQKLEDHLTDSEHQRIESDQEKRILDKMVTMGEQKILRLDKKNITIIAISAIIAGVGFSAYSLYVGELTGQQYKVPNIGISPSNYVIQNLRGDTVNTWVAWNIQTGRILHVNVINTANLSQDKIDAIKDAILSTKAITLDDSLLGKGPKGTSSVYYAGWEGALTKAYSEPTVSYIPQKFDISGSPNGPGDIVITLTNDVNPDGLSGFTKSIADGNEILKSKITIYRASELSSAQLEAITRHEFGHAMGLAHSTAPEDLMHATIQTDYPYISDCDIDAVAKLYDGGKKSEVICKK